MDGDKWEMDGDKWAMSSMQWVLAWESASSELSDSLGALNSPLTNPLDRHLAKILLWNRIAVTCWKLREI